MKITFVEKPFIEEKIDMAEIEYLPSEKKQLEMLEDWGWSIDKSPTTNYAAVYLPDKKTFKFLKKDLNKAKKFIKEGR